jgi:upstream activation factor subunit UAF30
MWGEFKFLHEARRSPVFNKPLTVRSHIMPKAKKESVRRKPKIVKRKTKIAKRKAKVSKRKPNAAFVRPVQPDNKLAEIVGSKPIRRSELTKKLWDYIKKHDIDDGRPKRHPSRTRSRGAGMAI